MAKTREVIKNVFEPGRQSDKYHLQYLQSLQLGETGSKAIEAFRAKDITLIDDGLKLLADNARSSILLIGIGCLIIDRERLYEPDHRSYLDYALHLYENLGMAPQTLSDAKIIAEVFVDRFSGLKKAGFKIENNAHKLRYLEAALANHADEEPEVYSRAANETFIAFKEWALSSERSSERYSPKVRVTATKITVDGKNILNLSEDLPEKERRNLAEYLGAVYSIRATGNEPFIVDTYDKGEQRAILNFLKKRREEK